MDRERDWNDPKSLTWIPINEVCGEDAYTSAGAFLIGSIDSKSRESWREHASWLAGMKLENYEARRTYEDGVGQLKIAAFNSSRKDKYDVLAVVGPLLETYEPVKVRSAFEILTRYIQGGI